MWHALLLSSVRLNVNDVTNPVIDEVCREFDETLLCESQVRLRNRNYVRGRLTLEFAFEEIPGTSPITVRVRHVEGLKI